VTGGGSGIGLAIATASASSEPKIAILGEKPSGSRSRKRSWRSAGFAAHAAVVDIREVEQIASFVDGVREALGPATSS